MTEPLVSVCIITYNHENYIRKALDSVFVQKVNFQWEVIIADDCSTDNTRQIILEYKNKYPGLVKLIFQETNTRAVKNFMDLMAAPKGKYIAYLEGDDYWTDDLKLQKQFDFMESHSDFSLCYHKTSWKFMYPSAEWEKFPAESNMNDSAEYTIYDILKRGWFIRSSSMFFKSIKLPGNFEKLYIGDYPLHILLADIGKVGFINQCMSSYRIHNQGMSETILLVEDITQRRKNNWGEIYLNKYLNKQTNYKYDSYFKKKIFDEIYSFNHFLFFKNKWGFIKNICYTLFNFNPFFLIRQLVYKITNHNNKPIINNY